MIPKDLAKHGDFLLWKTNRKTPWYLDVGGYTEILNATICQENHTDQLNGYNHIARIDEKPNHIIHAHPPRATRDQLTEKYWKKTFKKADAELWRLKKNLPEEQQKNITRQFYLMLDLKRKGHKIVGAKYDWAAIFLAFTSFFGLGLNAKERYHCSEIVVDSARTIGLILSSYGALDPLASPNNIINSDKLYKVWGEYLGG